MLVRVDFSCYSSSVHPRPEEGQPLVPSADQMQGDTDFKIYSFIHSSFDFRPPRKACIFSGVDSQLLLRAQTLRKILHCQQC